MKKILYVTTIGTTINAFLVPHILHLVNQGYQVDIATNIDVEINKQLLDKGVRVFYIPFQRNPLSKKNINAYKDIKKLQDEEKYDMVHVHTPVASFITRLALKDYSNLKLVYTCHGFHFYRGGSPINWIVFYPLEKIAAKWTDALITINSEDFEIAKQFKLRKSSKVFKINGVGIERENYVLENFDVEEYRSKLGFSKEDFIILVLAELNKNKNHTQLIEAIRNLKDNYPNIKSIFAGSGPLEKEIESKIKESGLEENIKLLGWRNDVKELIHVSDIIGLFSKREGLGKCLLEGMICKKSVIATNTRGPRELIEHDVNGFMFEVDDVESTSRYIEKLYLDSDLRHKFEENVVKVANEYLLDNVLNQLDNVYKDIYNEELDTVGELI